MRRRDLLAAMGGSAFGWSLAARGQQTSGPVVGMLSARSPDDSKSLMAELLRRLLESGYIEGQNVTIKYRWAQGDYDRPHTLAADLVSRHVSLIVATGGEPAALAAKAATSSIPIVFVIGGDPVKFGLVADLRRPGGNATGFSLLTGLLESKRFELLREVAANVAVIGVLVNPKFAPAMHTTRLACTLPAFSRAPNLTICP